jgi:hypothetical protein
MSIQHAIGADIIMPLNDVGLWAWGEGCNNSHGGNDGNGNGSCAVAMACFVA